MQENSKFIINNEEFFLIQKIGESHQKQVYVWLCTYQQKKYVLKCINKAALQYQQQIDFLFNEKNSLKELKHPSIIKLEKTLQDEYRLYLLLEPAFGLSLNKLLVSYNTLEQYCVKLILIQLVMFLEYIHDNQFIHRDIKLSNIIMDEQGIIKIIDFGFASQIKDQKQNVFCGTLHAMAPEFFKQPIEYDYKVDIYAVGIMLYEMLTGYPPYGYQKDEETNNKMKDEIQLGLQQNHLEKLEKFDQSLIDLIKNMCQVDQNMRFDINHVKQSEYLKEVDWEFWEKFTKKELEFDKYQEVCVQYQMDNYFEDIYLMGIQENDQERDFIADDNDIFNFI